MLEYCHINHVMITVHAVQLNAVHCLEASNPHTTPNDYHQTITVVIAFVHCYATKAVTRKAFYVLKHQFFFKIMLKNSEKNAFVSVFRFWRTEIE